MPRTLHVQRPCRYYLQGFCRDGDHCRFAHLLPGITSPTPPQLLLQSLQQPGATPTPGRPTPITLPRPKLPSIYQQGMRAPGGAQTGDELQPPPTPVATAPGALAFGAPGSSAFGAGSTHMLPVSPHPQGSGPSFMVPTTPSARPSSGSGPSLAGRPSTLSPSAPVFHTQSQPVLPTLQSTGGRMAGRSHSTSPPWIPTLQPTLGGVAESLDGFAVPQRGASFLPSMSAAGWDANRKVETLQSGVMPGHVSQGPGEPGIDEGQEWQAADELCPRGMRPVDSSEGLAMRAALLGLPDELDLEGAALSSPHSS